MFFFFSFKCQSKVDIKQKHYLERILFMNSHVRTIILEFICCLFDAWLKTWPEALLKG